MPSTSIDDEIYEEMPETGAEERDSLKRTSKKYVPSRGKHSSSKENRYVGNPTARTQRGMPDGGEGTKKNTMLRKQHMHFL